MCVLFYCTFIVVAVMLSLGTIKNKLLSAFQVSLMQIIDLIHDPPSLHMLKD